MIAFIVVLASLCVPAQTTPPAAENPGPPRTGSITGQVVDENEQPLPNAVVQIRAANSNTAQTVNTDREGQFQINNLEPVDYYISTSKPAYLPSRRNSSLRPSNTFRIGDRVTLSLVKGGVITGKVMDAKGDPVVMINVNVVLVRMPDGNAVNIGNTQPRFTDDRGVYRIYGLMAGSYVVAAGGADQSRSSESVFEFDVPTYAPGSNRETAAEISVRLGEEVTDVDIRYRNEQGHVISGDVTVPADSHKGFSVMLTTGEEAGSQYGETFFRSEDKRGFIFKGVADGDYTVIAQSYSQDGEMAVSEPKQVSVQRTDVTGIQLATKLLGSVNGRVVLEEMKIAACDNKENPLSTETSVFAWPRDDEAAKQIPKSIRSRAEPGRPDDKGTFLLKNLAPGAYYFGPSLRAKQWYVNSITFGPASTNAATKVKQVDATRVWTNIKNGDRLNGLTIAMAQGGVTLRGEFGEGPGERAPAGSFLYLVPVEREKANDVLRFFVTPIEQNGWFELNNIAPGRYWILAQMGGGNSVETSTKLRLPHESETRAQLRREAEAAKIEIEFKPCLDVVNFKLPLRVSVSLW